jgi:prepilin signal peptidase PulO-like enzyme (type II secretory pathway)
MFLICAFVLGIVFGSFISMISYRMVKGTSLFGRSRCPKCHHKLNALDLIPLLSYVFQGGKCRYCKKGVSFRYPTTEFATGLLFAIIANEFQGNYPELVLLCLISIGLMIMIVVDFEHYIIPDEVQIYLAICGVIYAILHHNPIFYTLFISLLSFCLAWSVKVVFKRVTKKDGLGFGDVKFFAVAGLYLSIEGLSAFLFIAGILGLVIASFWRLSNRGVRFPFGPALAISLYICIVFPSFIKLFSYAH